MARLLSGWLGLWSLVPVLASAQLVNFDAACPSPPCSVGTLFSASGVSFSPVTSQIVAAGTDGLTGPAGGSYLRVVASPYQQTIVFDRPVTFAAFQLSRAASSSGAVVAQFTTLNDGVQVGSDPLIMLSVVNDWAYVQLTVPGGFDSIMIQPLGGPGQNSTFGLAHLILGGGCFGFADVQPTDIFCNAAEWLGNRNITLGCAAGLYCPGSGVDRAQMALFMNRLGDALTPAVFNVELTSSAPLDPDASPRVCQTQEIPPKPYPRTALLRGTLSGLAAGPMQYAVAPQVALDGAGTFGLFVPVSHRNGTTASSWTSTTFDATFPLAAGRSHRFAIAFGRVSGSADFDEYICSLSAIVFNRTSTPAPFDVLPVPSQSR